MKSSKYLYGRENISELGDKTYREALKLKIKWGKELLDKLMEKHYTERDDDRIYHVVEAIRFNEILLEELDKPCIKENEYDKYMLL